MGLDGTAGLNVHSIAIEVPIEQLTRSGSRPASRSAMAAVIGVWSTASRPVVTVLSPGNAPEGRGEYVQVSRLGHPLVNEVVIPRGMKDRFNGSEPRDDAQFGAFVTDPELARLFTALFGLRVPPGPRNDLVQVFGDYSGIFSFCPTLILSGSLSWSLLASKIFMYLLASP